MSLFSHDDDDQEDRLDALRSSQLPLPEPEESEPDIVTLSCRRDDPVLEALVEATGKDAESLMAHALKIGIDLIKAESIEALARIYEMKLAGLEARLQALKGSVQAPGASTEYPKSLMKLCWAVLTAKEED